jgi:hypothetical protein
MTFNFIADKSFHHIFHSILNGKQNMTHVFRFIWSYYIHNYTQQAYKFRKKKKIQKKEKERAEIDRLLFILLELHCTSVGVDLHPLYGNRATPTASFKGVEP